MESAMTDLPRTFDESLNQMATAVQQGVAAGKYRGQIEFRTPDLNGLAILEVLVAHLPKPVQVLFPDAGAAALATQQAAPAEDVVFRSLTMAQADEYWASFVLYQVSGVEIQRAEQLAGLVLERPLVLVNPQLDAGVVGIGLAGRQLRTRFLNTFEMLYFLEPLEGGALRRSYPANWEVWQEQNGEYTLRSERGQRPNLEEINQTLVQKQDGFFAQLEKLIRALGR